MYSSFCSMASVKLGDDDKRRLRDFIVPLFLAPDREFLWMVARKMPTNSTPEPTFCSRLIVVLLRLNCLGGKAMKDFGSSPSGKRIWQLARALAAVVVWHASSMLMIWLPTFRQWLVEVNPLSLHSQKMAEIDFKKSPPMLCAAILTVITLRGTEDHRSVRNKSSVAENGDNKVTLQLALLASDDYAGKA